MAGFIPPKPPLTNIDRDLTKRESEFIKLLVNDPSLDANDAAKKAGFGDKKGYSVVSRRVVLAALVRDDQSKSLTWKLLMTKAKAVIERILDDKDAAHKDLINAAKLIMETIIKSKAMNLAETADAIEGDPISAILGPPQTDTEQ